MTRLTRAWRAMEPEQQLAAGAAFGLFVSMFLPWYSQTNTVVVGNAARATRASLSAFESFSWVEAAVLLVSAAVLTLLFARAEQRGDFHLPGGDGTVVMVAGGWTAVLVFYRLLDKPGLHGTQRITATVGVQWGIFIALLLALTVAYAGWRMRAGERPAPPLTRERAPRAPEESFGPGRPAADADPPRLGEESAIVTVPATPAGSSRPVPARGRPRYPPAPSDSPGSPARPAPRRRISKSQADQLSFEDATAEREEPPGDG
jgi:hypothetical protein